MSTATIYALSAGSGWCRNSNAGYVPWSSLHDGSAGTKSANNSDNQHRCYTDNGSDFSNRYIDRTFLAFDLTVLGAGASITAADLNVYCTGKTPDFHNDSLHGVSSGHTSGGLQASDWGSVGAVDYFTAVTFASFTVNAYRTLALNATALAAMNPSTNFRMALLTGDDFSNIDPTYQYPGFMGFDTPRATNKPYLTVTYTPPPGSAPPFRRRPSGLYTR